MTRASSARSADTSLVALEMPLEFELAAGGHTGAALRAHRGAHRLRATGVLLRLANLIPDHVVVSPDGAVLITYELALWVATAVLVVGADLRDVHVYMGTVGPARLGCAIEAGIDELPTDASIPLPVLRMRVRQRVEARKASGETLAGCVVSAADMYALSEGGFPTGAGIDDEYDWLASLTWGLVVSSDGSLNGAGQLVLPSWGPRWDVVCLGVGGGFERFGRALAAITSKGDAVLYSILGNDELAAEMAAWLGRALPLPDPLGVYPASPAAALRSLLRALGHANSGEAHAFDADTIGTALHFYEAARLVVGVDAGAGVTLSMFTELVRLCSSTAVQRVMIAQVDTALSKIDYLLPALRGDAVQALPRTERLAFVARELEAKRLEERAAPRSGGGGGGGSGGSGGVAGGGGGEAGSAVRDGDAPVGYALIYDAGTLLKSDGFTSIVSTAEAAMEAGDYDESIAVIFASGLLPLVHVLTGHRKPLPTVPFTTRVAQELRARGPQFVANTIAAVVLPPNTTGMRRARPPAQPEAWAAICSGAIDTIHWEKVVYSIKAAVLKERVPRGLALTPRYTSVPRMRETMPAVVALFQKAPGKMAGAESSLDTLLERIYVYQTTALCLPLARRTAEMAEVLTAAFREAATGLRFDLGHGDPNHQPSTDFLAPSSGALEQLAELEEMVPQQSEMKATLMGSLSEQQVRSLGISNVLEIPGMLDSGAEPPPAGGKGLHGGRALPGAEEQAPKEEEDEADDKGKRERKPPIGKYHARLCSETETHWIVGKEALPKAAVAKIKGVDVNDPEKFCPFTAASRAKWPAGVCGCKGKKGHEGHGSSAHTYTPAVKSKLLGLLVAASTVTGNTASTSAAEAQWVRPAGVEPAGGGGLAVVGLGDVQCGWQSGGAMAEGARDVGLERGYERLHALLGGASAAGATFCELGAVDEVAAAGGAAGASASLLGAAAPAGGAGAAPLPAAAVEEFEGVGGWLFLPVWHAGACEPHVGVPLTRTLACFGEASAELGALTSAAARTSTLALGWTLTRTLCAGRDDLIPFGFFEDESRAGGQVVGFVAGEPAPPGLVVDGPDELRALAARCEAGELEAGCSAQTGAPTICWLPVEKLHGTPLERLARLAVACVWGYAHPAPDFSRAGAKVGAMRLTRAGATATAEDQLRGAVRMSKEEVRTKAAAGVQALRVGVARRIDELSAAGTAVATKVAREMESWLGILRPPKLSEVADEVMAMAARATNPELATIPFPCYCRPVTSPRLPPLPQPSPPACIPGFAVDWHVGCFSSEASAACVEFFTKYRDACRAFLSGVPAEKVFGMLPQSMAFGPDHMQPWLAALVLQGHVLVKREGKLALLDQSATPPSQLNRSYIAELLAENNCTDLELEDMLLTKGAVYKADKPPLVCLQRPLRSTFGSIEGFRAIHGEKRRMRELGWFEVTPMPRLDEGAFELCSCPGYFDAVGMVERKLEQSRPRAIKDCGSPHTLLLTMAPPTPRLHNLCPGRRFPVQSTNALTGMRQSKAERKQLRQAIQMEGGSEGGGPVQAGVNVGGIVGGLAALSAMGSQSGRSQRAKPVLGGARFTPGLRREREPAGERDLLPSGLVEPAPADQWWKGWAGGRHHWNEEWKPFFIDLMLALAILSHAAELLGETVYVLGSDLKDMFHVFALAFLQLYSMGSLCLDVEAVARGEDGGSEAAMAVVMAKCMEMGVSPSSNVAQRFASETDAAFSRRFGRANEARLCKLEESNAEFRALRDARRALSVETQRDETGCHWMATYTDDACALVVGVESMVLFLEMLISHYGWAADADAGLPAVGLNMRLSIPEKRAFGVAAPYVGGNLLTVGMLCYVSPEKALRTHGALTSAIEGTLDLAAFTKLVGLLNHLACLLLMPYYVNYDCYGILDACRAAGVQLDQPIVLTPRGLKGLRRWRERVQNCSGTTALAAVYAMAPMSGAGIKHAMYSDACIEGSNGKPALCGNLYRHVFILKLTVHWLQMPIVALEFLGELLNLVVFGEMLRGAPAALIGDALVVVRVAAGKAKSPMTRFLQEKLVAISRAHDIDLYVAHLYGCYQPITDAGSRDKIPDMEAVMRHMGMEPEYVAVPEEGVALMDEALDFWLELSEGQRCEARLELDAMKAESGAKQPQVEAATAEYEGARGCNALSKAAIFSTLGDGPSGGNRTVEFRDDDVHFPTCPSAPRCFSRMLAAPELGQHMFKCEGCGATMQSWYWANRFAGGQPWCPVIAQPVAQRAAPQDAATGWAAATRGPRANQAAVAAGTRGGAAASAAATAPPGSLIDDASPDEEGSSEQISREVQEVGELRPYLVRGQVSTGRVKRLSVKAAFARESMQAEEAAAGELEQDAAPQAWTAAPRPQFSEGEAVSARFRAQELGEGRTMWFLGVIAAVKPSGRYDVRFDDGDFESDVPPKFVRPTDASPERGVGAVERMAGAARAVAQAAAAAAGRGQAGATLTALQSFYTPAQASLRAALSEQEQRTADALRMLQRSGSVGQNASTSGAETQQERRAGAFVRVEARGPAQVVGGLGRQQSGASEAGVASTAPILPPLSLPAAMQAAKSAEARGGDEPKGKASQPRKAPRRRCGTCDNCTRPDCGQCTYCLDKVSFGGMGTIKKPCVRKVCMLLLAGAAGGPVPARGAAACGAVGSSTCASAAPSSPAADERELPCLLGAVAESTVMELLSELPEPGSGDEAPEAALQTGEAPASWQLGGPHPPSPPTSPPGGADLSVAGQLLAARAAQRAPGGNSSAATAVARAAAEAERLMQVRNHTAQWRRAPACGPRVHADARREPREVEAPPAAARRAAAGGLAAPRPRVSAILEARAAGARQLNASRFARQPSAASGAHCGAGTARSAVARWLSNRSSSGLPASLGAVRPRRDEEAVELSESQLRRRQLGVAVMPSDPGVRDEMLGKLHEILSSAYAPNTIRNDRGHWRKWERFCAKMGTSPWRTDVLANSGVDVEGYQEEVFLVASAVIQFYDEMKPRRKTDPDADPRSAKKNMEGVYRVARTSPQMIEMVDMRVVNLTVKGLCRRYIEQHGVDTLSPERKLPFSDQVLRGVFATPNGATQGNLTVDWGSYYWLAILACFSVLAETGARKDEVAKEKAGLPFRKGRITFGSLIWKIRGKVERHPTVEQLRTLAPGDGVYFKHGIMKNDPRGSYFSATPSFLAFNATSERNACRTLAELEIAAAVLPSRRNTTPLFGPTVGAEFTHAQLDSALRLMLMRGAGLSEVEADKYSVHSFRIYLACALLAADAPRWRIKRMLRWRGDESLEAYARINDKEWSEWIGRTYNVEVDSTIAARLTDFDFSPEVMARFDAIARSLLSLTPGGAREAAREL